MVEIVTAADSNPPVYQAPVYGFPIQNQGRRRPRHQGDLVGRSSFLQPVDLPHSESGAYCRYDEKRRD
jgi:hypothetical protein